MRARCCEVVEDGDMRRNNPAIRRVWCVHQQEWHRLSFEPVSDALNCPRAVPSEMERTMPDIIALVPFPGYMGGSARFA